VDSGGEARSHNAAKQPKISARVDIGTRPGGVQHTSHLTRPLHLPIHRGQPQPPAAASQSGRPDSRSTIRGPRRPTSKASISSSRSEPSGPVLKGGARRILLPTCADAVPKTAPTLADRPALGSRLTTAASKPKVPARPARSTTGKPVRMQVKPTSRCASASPEISPTAIPLPPSPVSSSEQDGHDTADKLPLTTFDPPEQRPTIETTGTPPFLLAPPSDSPSKTPITALLTSIQRGFLFTPSSPLSPPQAYLPAPSGDNTTDAGPSFDLTIPLHRSLKQDFMDAAGKQNPTVVDPSIN